MEPQRSWTVNEPLELKNVIEKLEDLTEEFNQTLPKGVLVSLADVIVLGGRSVADVAVAVASAPAGAVADGISTRCNVSFGSCFRQIWS